MDKSTLVLKRDELGRVRTPAQKRVQMVEEFKHSGLSASKFAQLVGVHYNTFWNWLYEQGLTARRGKRRAPCKPRLVEVCLQAPAASSSVATAALQLVLPGGAQLTINDAAQVPLAAQLLKALA